MRTDGSFELALADGGVLVLDGAAVDRLISRLRAEGYLDGGEGTAAVLGGGGDAPTSGGGRVVLAEDSPMWVRHSGGQRWHSGPNWEPGDEALAERTYARLADKTRVFTDLLVDHPGEVFSVPEIIAAAPEVFASDRAIAGSLNGYRVPCAGAGRQFPFTWWEGQPTEYAMHPRVAAVWAEGRRRWRSNRAAR